ncbi:MAG: DUF4115 domain-containing protein [Rhodospirillales bacterium]|nr:DUF4115 domain-containing protein [Rhodospirillales bacterium]
MNPGNRGERYRVTQRRVKTNLMSNKDQNKDKDAKNGADRSPPVGALLRASRLRVGEELRAVADVLCIRYPYLEAIENCRYEQLPGNTYAVGFIRTYAEHLGLDGDEVVRRYRAEQVGKRSATDLAFPTPVQDSGVPKGAIVFIGVMLALIVYGGWYVTTTDESTLSDLISPVPDHLKQMVNGEGEVGKADMSAAPVVPESTSPALPDSSQTGSASAEAETEKVAREVVEAAKQSANTAIEAVAPVVGYSSPTMKNDSVSAKPTEAVDEVDKPVTETTNKNTSLETADPVAKAVSPVVPAPEQVVSKPAPVVVPKEPVKPAIAAQPAQASRKPEPPVVSEPITLAAPVTEQAATPAAEPQTSAATASNPEQPRPGTNEVTAEDLNKLVLRQATGGPTQSANQKTDSTKVLSGPAAKTSGIVIYAIGSSWVEIKNPQNGTIVFTGLMKDGNAFNVPDIKGLTLDTGNAGALKITVDGIVVPEIGSIGAVRKNVALDAPRLKAGTAIPR